MLDWTASLQKRARKIARECGLVVLTLVRNGKKAQVKYRKSEGSKVISQETVMLKHEWIKSNEDDIYTRFRNICKLMGESGHNLKAAAGGSSTTDWLVFAGASAGVAAAAA